MMHFRFFVKLSDKEITIDESGNTFKDCLIKAENRAAHMGGEVTAWEEIIFPVDLATLNRC